MKPGKGLRRTGFTNRGKPLRRYTELRRSSTSGAGSGTTGEGGSVVSSAGRPRATRRMPAEVAELVKARSGDRCEFGIEGCWGTAWESHHRITRKAGGRHRAARAGSDRCSNLIRGCHACHQVVTDNPKWAYTQGWCLREWQEPTAEPVLYRGELSYLDDAGSVHSFDKAGA
jgi:hypothetical protein